MTMSVEHTALPSKMTLFEFPLNERFRSYLRLEALYARWLHYVSLDSDHDHHSALMTMFEINEFAFRYDLKSDLLMDFNRYKLLLNQLRHLPELSEQRLAQTLMRLTDAQKQVEQSPKFGSLLSENDWLLNVKTRIAVPGGICSSDVGFYYKWLQQPAALRREDLLGWFIALNPLFDGLNLLLMLVRSLRKRKACISENYAYQQPLNGSKFDLLQIEQPETSTMLPDISANKHVIWMRFTQPSYRYQPVHLKPELVNMPEISFHLSLCGTSKV